MDWPVYALIAYAIVGVAALIWIDMRYKPPAWLSWLLMTVAGLSYAYFLFKWAGLSNVEMLWALPLCGVAVAFRTGVDWLFEKFRTRNDG